ncbi:MAG: CPBP family intramembrane metalloprotease [Candidatus Moranbacteria bacterium]|nr:CPBP family intramembrane metalloprotease [Candidatus Moranbacteria bacterium]
MNLIPLLSRWKRFLMTGVFVVASLLLYGLFPTESRLSGTIQSLTLGAAVFLVLPILFAKTVLHEPLSALGFRGSNRRFGAVSIPLVVIPILSIWYVLLRTYPVASSYTLPSTVRSSFPIFLFYEIVLVGVIAFLYETFFRGLVQILWLRSAGLWAVFIQAALFFVFVVSVGGGFSWQDMPLCLAGLASGFVASYTGSVSYAWVSAWLVLFLSDVLILVSR